jgi:hypothetical protein
MGPCGPILFQARLTGDTMYVKALFLLLGLYTTSYCEDDRQSESVVAETRVSQEVAELVEDALQDHIKDRDAEADGVITEEEKKAEEIRHVSIREKVVMLIFSLAGILLLFFVARKR